MTSLVQKKKAGGLPVGASIARAPVDNFAARPSNSSITVGRGHPFNFHMPHYPGMDCNDE
jgi:hypothetical protein